MQITIAIAVPYHQYREWKREENKNAVYTVQKSIDSTKQKQRKTEGMRSLTTEVHVQLLKIWIRKKRKSENADDTKQIEDDTKQNCGMKTYGICGSPRVPIL
ncbi:hypothetical protein T4A_1316 [Trichinella pseudospiralis]|uniref:Uncharacterized protein n=1 Tax=Trichinella pseudospiralis TaxID=6337 RepID=A0A0V1EL25_TRIPS|nr:hypothetical protein T4A_1316 [Trichinella pseudospiralis]